MKKFNILSVVVFGVATLTSANAKSNTLLNTTKVETDKISESKKVIQSAKIADNKNVEPVVLPEVREPSQPGFDFGLSLGYSSAYVFRGLIYSGDNGYNIVPIRFDGAYDFGNNLRLEGGVQYTIMTRTGFKHSESGHPMNDGARGDLKLSKDWGNGWVTKLGYEYINGGMITLFAPPPKVSKKGSARNGFSSLAKEEHDIVFDVQYDMDNLGLKGWFWKNQTVYAFQWRQGWWMNNAIGYKSKVSDRSDIVISGIWDVSMGYFDQDTFTVNGSMGYALLCELPTKLSESWQMTPFVRTQWLGNGGRIANERIEHLYHRHLYREFTVVGGVTVKFTF